MIKRRKPSPTHVKRFLNSSKIRRKRKQKRIIFTILIVILLVCSVIGFVKIVNLQTFTLKEVKIVGLKKADAIQIEKIARDEIDSEKHFFGLISPKSSFVISDKKIEDLLLSNIPRLKSVSVSSHMGGELEIVIEERNPLALWCDASLNTEVAVQSVSTTTRNVLVSSTATSTVSISTSTPVTTETKTKESCFDIDANGLIFGTSTEQKEYVFKGIVTDGPIGKYYLNQDSLEKMVSFLKFLREKKMLVSNINCSTSNDCDVILQNNAKILLHVSDDLELAMDRFEVALEMPALQKNQFEYVDLRYGNKIFYKAKGGEGASSTVTNLKSAVTSKPTTTSTSTKPR